MATKYTTQSISGYNATPPADDGSAVESNKVKWATHKTKLADPVKTLAEAIDTALVAYVDRQPLLKSTAYTTVATDHLGTIETTGTTTITLGAVASMGTGYTVTVKNAGSGTVTVEGSGSETIDGELNYSLGVDDVVTVVVDNSAGSYLVTGGERSEAQYLSGVTSAIQTQLDAKGDLLSTNNLSDVANSTTSRSNIAASGQEVFSSSGTFTVPAGVTSIDVIIVAGGSGGGGGGGYDNVGGKGGGGGKAGNNPHARIILGHSVTPTAGLTVTIGSGGTGGAGGILNNDGGTGGTGGTTTFDSVSVTGNTGGIGGVSGSQPAQNPGGNGSVGHDHAIYGNGGAGGIGGTNGTGTVGSVGIGACSGGGGGGGTGNNNATAAAGGAGVDGICIVMWS